MKTIIPKKSYDIEELLIKKSNSRYDIELRLSHLNNILKIRLIGCNNIDVIGELFSSYDIEILEDKSSQKEFGCIVLNSYSEIFTEIFFDAYEYF